MGQQRKKDEQKKRKKRDKKGPFRGESTRQRHAACGVAARIVGTSVGPERASYCGLETPVASGLLVTKGLGQFQ